MAIDLWTGRGIWEGWSIRKHYESCKFGDSVLVSPDGSTFYPDELMRLRENTFDENEKFTLKNKRAEE